MEGHSHFAFGGWGFMILFFCFYHAFLNKDRINNRIYSCLFYGAFFSVWGMLISFPFRGYAGISTAFSTLYIWVTYWFAFRFYRDIKGEKTSFSLKLAKAALFLLVFSSIGPYTMGVIMALGHGSDPRAINAIYFYLHLQYNGWFIFGILALLFKWMEQHKIRFSLKKAKLFYNLLFWSCFPAYLLSVLWSKPGEYVFILAGIAGLVQLLAVIPLFQILNQERKAMKAHLNPVIYRIGILFFIVYTLKYIFQLSGAIPEVVSWTVANRNLVIAYLHLVFLGVFTIFMLSYVLQEQLVPLNKWSTAGLLTFLAGFILTEGLLFGQAGLRLLHIYIPSFGSWMFYTTLPLLLGVVIIWAVLLSPSSSYKEKERTKSKVKEQPLSADELSHQWI